MKYREFIGVFVVAAVVVMVGGLVVPSDGAMVPDQTPVVPDQQGEPCPGGVCPVVPDQTPEYVPEVAVEAPSCASCRTPVRKAVKAAAAVPVKIAAAPIRAVKRVQPVRRVGRFLLRRR